MTVNYTAILEDMIATTREAGALTLEHFRRFRDIEIGVKGPGDFVSDADRQSETLIRERLLGRYPWGLTGEEFAPVDGSDAEH
ncbi:MAG: inositol monophosphatase family protein, partial [Agrobacterium sp.]